MRNSTRRYVAYYRVSTAKQGRSGLGLRLRMTSHLVTLARKIANASVAYRSSGSLFSCMSR